MAGSALFAFIPRRVPNRVVLGFYDLLSRRGRMRPSVMASPARPARPIEDQRRRRDERFGRSTVARAGCEAIAVYNALLLLLGGEAVSLSDLIGMFGRRGMTLGGRWGTSPRALLHFFRAAGFDTAFTTDAARFDEIAQGFPCAIVSFYNDGTDIREGVHTVCAARERGSYVAHNLTEDGRARGPYPSIAALLAGAPGGRAAGLCLIGVARRGTDSP